MPDTTIFAYTESVNDYPAYINLKRTADGKCLLTVRSRGNGGRDQGCIEVSPETLESLQNELCDWLYRDEADRLMQVPEAEVDAELRRLGFDPEDLAARGRKAIDGALETMKKTPWRVTSPWTVVALLRKPGEPRSRYIIRRVVWTADNKPQTEWLHDDGELRLFGPDDYEQARAVAKELNDAHGVPLLDGDTNPRNTPMKGSSNG